MNTEYEWLNNLKSGDKVIRRSTGLGAVDEIVTVNRVTATQIIVGSERYRKVNGRRMGKSTWYSCWIKEATPEQVESITNQRRHLKLGRQLQDVRWKNLPRPVLEAVAAIVDNHAAESESTND